MRTPALAFVSILLTACVSELDTESASVGAVRDCRVTLPPAIRVSAPIDAGTTWIFDWAMLFDGTEVRGAVAEITGDPCDGIDLVRDESGAVRSILVLTTAEAIANDTRTDGKRLVLYPRAAVDGILYYDHVLLGPGFFDAETLGTGLCRLSSFPCERLQGGAPMWSGTSLPIRSASLDGELVYVAACRKAAAFEEHCTLGRVERASIEDPAAYRWLNVFDGWIESAGNATVAFDHIGAVSLSVNPYLGGWTAVTMDVFESSAAVRIAETPEAAFSRDVPLFHAEPPEGWFVAGGVEHPALREDGGRTIRVSWSSDDVLHLTTVRFHGRIEP